MFTTSTVGGRKTSTVGGRKNSEELMCVGERVGIEVEQTGLEKARFCP
jgi:hypothetical protein